MAVNAPTAVCQATSVVAGATLQSGAVQGGSNSAKDICFVFAVCDILDSGGSCSDTQSNSYVLVTSKQLTDSNGRTQTLYVFAAYLTNALVAGTDTITVTFGSATAAAKVMLAYAIHATSPDVFQSGAASSAFVDPGAAATASSAATSTTPSITSGVPTYRKDVLLACFALNGPGGDTMTEDAGWTRLDKIGTTTLVGDLNKTLITAYFTADPPPVGTAETRAGSALSTARSYTAVAAAAHPAIPKNSRVNQMPSAAVARAGGW